MSCLEFNTTERITAAQEALLAMHNWAIDQIIELEKGDEDALTRVTNNVRHALKLLSAFDPARYA